MRAAVDANSPVLRGLGPILAPSQSQFDRDQAMGERTAKATVGDYVRSALSQDSPIDGAIGWAVGKQFQPDPSYNPYDEKFLAEVGKGIDPQFQNELLQATSREHALYIATRLAQKQEDLTRLGDLGLGGQLGRFALGFVDPANLALGIASGGVTALVRGGTTIARGSKMIQQAAKAGDAGLAAEGASVISKAAKSEASVGGIAAGLGSAAAGGYAFERLRQSVNFEDSQGDAAVAALMGTVFAAPFIGVNARSMARVRARAEEELKVYNAIKRVQDGGAPATADELAAAARINARAELAREKAAQEDALWAQNEAGARNEKLDLQAEREAAAARRVEAEHGKATAVEGSRKRAAAERKAAQEDANAETRAVVEKALSTESEKGTMADAFAKALHMDEVPVHDAPADPLEEMRALLVKADAAKREQAAPPAETPVETASVSDKGPKDYGPSTTIPGTVVPEVEQRAHPDLLGEHVQFAGEHGETVFGMVVEQHPDGMLRVETENGKRITVDRSDLAGETMDAPDGWMPGSVGAGKVAPLGDDLTGLSRFRFDIYARLNKSENSEVRALADVMVKDAIQKSEFYAQDRTASEEKKLLQRRLAGNFHFEAGEAYKEAAKALGWGLRQTHDTENIASFYEAAGRLARGEERVLDMGKNRAIEPQLRRTAAEFRKVMDAMLVELKKSGVKGADEVAENPAYVNRIWNIPKMTDLMRSVGEENVVRLVANATRVPGLTGDMDKARAFLTAVQRLEHSHMSTNMALGMKDTALLRAELKKAKLGDDEINSVIDTLFEAKEATGDSGNAKPNLKFRFKIDENESLDVNGRTISIADLLENDARVLMDRYMGSMAGHAALAKKGITSRADFDARLRAANKEHEANGLSRSAGAFDQEKQILEDLYSNIIGRPMSVHSFNTGDRVAGVMRALARSVYLGQLGFTATLELFHAASLSTFSAAWKQMPSFADFVRAARHGYVPNDAFAADLRTMFGFGTEHASSYARQHEISEFTYDKSLTWAENASNKLSHVVDKVSGNNFMTSYSRGLAARFMTQKYADFASGKLKLDSAARKRLVGQGIHSDDIDSVLSKLRQYTDRDSSGAVTGIRHEDWSAKDPESYHAFNTAIQREVRGAIQDHDLGETWYHQHTAIGKIFTELRAFSIAAHSKQFLNSLYYHDHRSMHLWVTGFVTQAMGYVMQTATNYAHDAEKRQKMLTPEKIALAAYKRMSVTGLLPMFTEPFLPQKLRGLTANTENRMPWWTPSMGLGTRAVNALGAGVQTGLYGENFTGKDVRDTLGLLPGSNAYGARNVIDWMGSLAPKSEQRPTP